ncbi:MAG: hypothetical protein ABSG28_09085 [Methanoregula sp.]|jgi:hypothetical protein|uniref:hypothetical protein n=1 Tax=Methanoregula sp. TaxID=2052170 RepID=UPI003C16CA27
MEILYKIKCEVPLRVSWHGYAPTDSTEWIKLPIKDKVVAKIGMTHALIAICGCDKESKDLTNTTFSSDGLIIEIEGCWPKEISELLRKPEFLRAPLIENDLLKTFRQDIQEILEQISFNLIDNIRNYFGQWWLSENFPFDENSFNDTFWRDSDGEWKRIYPKTIVLKCPVRLFGLSKRDWQELGTRLQKPTKVNMFGTMMANAKAHLDNNDGRVAIVESVCALESAIKQYIPSLLAEMVEPPIPEGLLDNAVKEMGLRLTATIIFVHLSKKLNLDSDNCSKCLQAIEIRNNIVHNQQRAIPVNDARQYVGAIDQIIKSINAPGN